MTFPVAQIAKRPGIEGVKVAKVMSTYHTYSSALFNLNAGYEWNNQLDIFIDHHVKLILLQVDCTASEAICKQYDVKGYPTILYFR